MGRPTYRALKDVLLGTDLDSQLQCIGHPRNRRCTNRIPRHLVAIAKNRMRIEEDCLEEIDVRDILSCLLCDDRSCGLGTSREKKLYQRLWASELKHLDFSANRKTSIYSVSNGMTQRNTVARNPPFRVGRESVDHYFKAHQTSLAVSFRSTPDLSTSLNDGRGIADIPGLDARRMSSTPEIPDSPTTPIDEGSGFDGIVVQTNSPVVRSGGGRTPQYNQLPTFQNGAMASPHPTQNPFPAANAVYGPVLHRESEEGHLPGHTSMIKPFQDFCLTKKISPFDGAFQGRRKSPPGTKGANPAALKCSPILSTPGSDSATTCSLTNLKESEGPAADSVQISGSGKLPELHESPSRIKPERTTLKTAQTDHIGRESPISPLSAQSSRIALTSALSSPISPDGAQQVDAARRQPISVVQRVLSPPATPMAVLKKPRVSPCMQQHKQRKSSPKPATVIPPNTNQTFAIYPPEARAGDIKIENKSVIVLKVPKTPSPAHQALQSKVSASSKEVWQASPMQQRKSGVSSPTRIINAERLMQARLEELAKESGHDVDEFPRIGQVWTMFAAMMRGYVRSAAGAACCLGPS